MVRSTRSAIESALTRLRLRGRSGNEGYGAWWNAAASTTAGAYATTYVTDDETDYRSRGWNGDANSFGARQLIAMAGLGPASRVLEIGCGMARVGREMAPHVGEWHGADISRNMLAHARRRTAGLANVFLHELPDVGLREFADASFDFVYATTVFMHLDKEDLYQYLIESRRVLKPGGMAFFDTWNLLHADTYRQWRGIQAHNLGTAKIRGRIQFTTAPELRRYLEEVGFDVLRLDEDRLLRALCRKSDVMQFDPDDRMPPFGYVDAPRNEGACSGALEVAGWALDAVESVEVRFDGGPAVGKADLGLARPDVAEVFPRYCDGGRCGFRVEVPLGDLAPGRHTLQVVARDRDGAECDLCGAHLAFLVAGPGA